MHRASCIVHLLFRYRDSKLTLLLKSALRGDCRLVMIANVQPSHL